MLAEKMVMAYGRMASVLVLQVMNILIIDKDKRNLTVSRKVNRKTSPVVLKT
jgi:hypothetical protein